MTTTFQEHSTLSKLLTIQKIDSDEIYRISNKDRRLILTPKCTSVSSPIRPTTATLPSTLISPLSNLSFKIDADSSTFKKPLPSNRSFQEETHPLFQKPLSPNSLRPSTSIATPRLRQRFSRNHTSKPKAQKTDPTLHSPHPPNSPSKTTKQNTEHNPKYRNCGITGNLKAHNIHNMNFLQNLRKRMISKTTTHSPTPSNTLAAYNSNHEYRQLPVSNYMYTCGINGANGVNGGNGVNGVNSGGAGNYQGKNETPSLFSPLLFKQNSPIHHSSNLLFFFYFIILRILVFGFFLDFCTVPGHATQNTLFSPRVVVQTHSPSAASGNEGFLNATQPLTPLATSSRVKQIQHFSNHKHNHSFSHAHKITKTPLPLTPNNQNQPNKANIKIQTRNPNNQKQREVFSNNMTNYLMSKYLDKINHLLPNVVSFSRTSHDAFLTRTSSRESSRERASKPIIVPKNMCVNHRNKIGAKGGRELSQNILKPISSLNFNIKKDLIQDRKSVV